MRFRLFPLRSPLLRESLLLSFPLVTKMFQFTKFTFSCLWIQQWNFMGCPIRESSDQNYFPIPWGISLVITPFIVSQCLEIHRTPFNYYNFPLQWHLFFRNSGGYSSAARHQSFFLKRAAGEKTFFEYLGCRRHQPLSLYWQTSMWRQAGSNRWHQPCKGCALPTELYPQQTLNGCLSYPFRSSLFLPIAFG